jgi:hypothetical protein
MQCSASKAWHQFDTSTSSDSTLGTHAARMVRYVLAQPCIADAFAMLAARRMAR